MERISFALPEKRKIQDRSEWDETIRLLCDVLNVGLPKKYIDKQGKEKIAKKFTRDGLHFRLIKSSLHKVKQIKASCEQSNNPGLTFNILTKDISRVIPKKQKVLKIWDNF